MTDRATAAGTLALCALLALSAVAGPALVAIALLVASVATAVGWAPLLGLPSPRGTAVAVSVAAAAALAALAGSYTFPRLSRLPLVLALAVLVAFVHQLLRSDGRPRVVDSVCGTVGGQVLAVQATAWMVLPRLVGGREMALAACAALAVATAGMLGPWAWRVRLPLAVLAAGAVGTGIMPSAGLPLAAGLVLGLLCGAVTVLVRPLLQAQPSSGLWPASVPVATVPVLAAGTGVYLVTRMFLN